MTSRLHRSLFSPTSLVVLTLLALLYWLTSYEDAAASQPAAPVIPAEQQQAATHQEGGKYQWGPELTIDTAVLDSAPPETTLFRGPSTAPPEWELLTKDKHTTGTAVADFDRPAETMPPDNPVEEDDGAWVKLKQGHYAGGVIRKSTFFPKAIEVWRGIPYAQSTAGKNRFRPPQPLPYSDTVFEATEFGPACPSDGAARESEDCLNLNVYRPARVEAGGEAAELLPVVVYIHGGAFNYGLAQERNMASFVSWAEDNMISVSFNYRVGALGFLPSELVANEGLLNLGLRDQQAALAWVKNNIALFGGDPGRVTIMGLSAGAHSVGHHINYYARKGNGPAPFSQAILESGGATARATFVATHPRHLVQFREFLVKAGVAGVPEDETLEALRELPLETVLRASRAVWRAYTASVRWPFQPSIDGQMVSSGSGALIKSNLTADPLIRTLPLRAIQKGRHLHVPVLTGFAANEGTLFVPHAAETNADFRAFFAALLPGFDSADLDTLCELYPDPVTDPSSPYQPAPAGRGAQFLRLDAAYAHYAYICPVLQQADYFMRNYTSPAASSSLSSEDEADRQGSQGSQAGDAPVWVYEYAALSGATRTANHGDNALPVSHDANVLQPFPGLTRVADAMHGAWARFVSTGDPNPPNPAPEWARHGAGLGGKLMVFGEGNDERAGGKAPGTPAKLRQLTGDELEKCRFWWERTELSEGLGRRGGGKKVVGDGSKL
jgi:carboxylesterase type B